MGIELNLAQPQSLSVALLKVSAGAVYGWTIRSQLQQPWQTSMHDKTKK